MAAPLMPECVHGISAQTCVLCRGRRRAAPERQATAGSPAPSAPYSARGTAGSSLSDLWPEYAKWNDSVIEEFLSGSSRGRPVYLDLEQQTLVKVAGRAGVSPPDAQREFVRVIRYTLNIPPAAGRVFHRHQVMVELWKQGPREKPPWCVALLAFLSFVAAGMVQDEKFSAGNYYGRLCDVLEINEPPHRQKVQRDFAEELHLLWDALNNWLDDTRHEFGRPSAYAFDRRTHIGIAISQALMRAQDRRRLRALFIECDLSPGQSLPPSEMTRLLEDWIPRSTVTPALKMLWQRSDTHEPIARIAQMELEVWDGGEEEEGDTRGDLDLLLVAYLRAHPVGKINVGLRVRTREGIPFGPYRLGAEAKPSARAALEGCSGTLWLRECGAEGWLEAEDCSRISIPDVLQAQLELHCGGGGEWSVTRVARRIVPLRFEEVTQLYIESRRVTLGDTHLILAHQSIAGEVGEFLGQVAGGEVRRRTDGLRGLPAEWVAFGPVVMMRKADSVIEELAALTPLSDVRVSVESGFALPGHLTWHSACPPCVRSVALGRESVQLILVTGQDLEGPSEQVRERVLATFADEAVTDLAGLGLGDGDYRLVLEQCGTGEEKEFLSSMSVRLRSADHPRPWVGTQAVRLRHEFSDPAWAAVSATVNDGGASECSVVAGAVVSAVGAVDATVHDDLALPARPGARGLSDSEIEASEPELSIQAQSKAPSCLFGGYHIFVIPARPRGGVYTGRCRDCGMGREYALRRRARIERGQRVLATREAAKPLANEARRPAIPLEAFRPRNVGDELLDALSYARGGSWEGFAGLANQLDDSPWFALETARLLDALGHIDISMDRDRWRPEAWAIAPTAIAIVGDGNRAVLCGARSKKVLLRLSEDIASVGGSMERETSSGGIAIVKLCGLDPGTLASVAESVTEHVGENIIMVDHMPQRLLSILPNLVDVARTLPVVGWPSLPVEIYDFEQGTWRAIAEPEQPGAYRFRTRPWIYVYVSGRDIRERRGRIGDTRVVKYLAARELGGSLIGYDPERQLLMTPWGAQLPGLYERVAVLCSGEPPQKMVDGTVAYRSVSSGIAAALWRKLT
jgi:hypothetical protein